MITTHKQYYLNALEVKDLIDVGMKLKFCHGIDQDILSRMISYLYKNNPSLREKQVKWWYAQMDINKIEQPQWLLNASVYMDLQHNPNGE